MGGGSQNLIFFRIYVIFLFFTKIAIGYYGGVQCTVSDFFSKNLPICSFSRFAHFSQSSKYGAIAHLHEIHYTSAHLNIIIKIGANTDLERLFYTGWVFLSATPVQWTVSMSLVLNCEKNKNCSWNQIILAWFFDN